MLYYTLSVLVAFLGLPIGIILGRKVWVEVEPGRPYLLLLAKAVAVLFFVAVMPSVGLPVALLCLASILVGTVLHQPAIMYGAMGLAIFISRAMPELSVFLLAMAYSYGLACGSLMVKEKNSAAEYAGMLADALPLLVGALLPLAFI